MPITFSEYPTEKLVKCALAISKKYGITVEDVMIEVTENTGRTLADYLDFLPSPNPTRINPTRIRPSNPISDVRMNTPELELSPVSAYYADREKNKTVFSEMPYEMLFEIAKNLELKDVLNMCETDASLSRMCNDNYFIVHGLGIESRDVILSMLNDRSLTFTPHQRKHLIRMYKAFPNSDMDNISADMFDEITRYLNVQEIFNLCGAGNSSAWLDPWFIKNKLGIKNRLYASLFNRVFYIPEGVYELIYALLPEGPYEPLHISRKDLDHVEAILRRGIPRKKKGKIVKWSGEIGNEVLIGDVYVPESGAVKFVEGVDVKYTRPWGLPIIKSIKTRVLRYGVYGLLELKMSKSNKIRGSIRRLNTWRERLGIWRNMIGDESVFMMSGGDLGGVIAAGIAFPPKYSTLISLVPRYTFEFSHMKLVKVKGQTFPAKYIVDLLRDHPLSSLPEDLYPQNYRDRMILEYENLWGSGSTYSDIGKYVSSREMADMKIIVDVWNKYYSI